MENFDKVYVNAPARITKKKKQTGVFDVVNVIILALFAVMCLYPFVNILFTSFSSEVDYYASTVLVIPRHFTVEAYRYILLWFNLHFP